ncbi:MAG TPA: TonB-dependent receptor, partial [bacterium]
SEIQLQLYYDRVQRRESAVRGTIHTVDVDFQHDFLWGSNQEIIWGGGYRFVSDDFDSTLAFSLHPASRQLHLFNAFFQNEISFIERKLRVIFGSKLEHNMYTGVEIQPNLRLQWTPNPRHTAWGALSRAVRTPSRAENDARIISDSFTHVPPPYFQILFGDHAVDSEKLTALEAGYRVHPADGMVFDLTAFYNLYDKLQILHEGMPYLDPDYNVLVLPLIAENTAEATNIGFEISGSFTPSQKLKFTTVYSFLNMDIKASGASTLEAQNIEGQSPKHQIFFRTTFEPLGNLTLDIRLRYVEELPSLQLHDYVNGDFHLGWQINRNMGLSVVVHNLFHQRLPESRTSLSGLNAPFIQSGTAASEIQRGIYSKITWRF